jgi:hypothetical protein
MTKHNEESNHSDKRSPSSQAGRYKEFIALMVIIALLIALLYNLCGSKLVQCTF